MTEHATSKKKEASSVKHIPVLLHECLEGLALRPGAVVVDATLGGGSYSRALCKAVGEDGTLIGFDRDAEAVVNTSRELSACPCHIRLFEGNFKDIDSFLAQGGITQVDAIVFDLGMSTVQLEKSGRGFSFQRDEPLLMTYDERPGESDITAWHIINTWSEEAIADVLYGYGEERQARKIARAIATARDAQPIETTAQLVAVIEKVQSGRGRHPATRTFQALRIAVNDELRALRDALVKGFGFLTPGGRLAVVSFHSIEDRIVKRFFKTQVENEKGTLITKKPVVPSREEIEKNPRSRSAKLRIIEKKTTNH